MPVAVAAGVVLGVFSKAVNAVAPAWTGNSLALWLLVAFLVGLTARTARDAAARGCVALVVANCSYYAWRLFVVDDIGLRFTVRAFAFWTALAVPAGLAAGALATRPAHARALLAGAFAGEAAFTLANGGRVGHAVVAAIVAATFAVRTRWSGDGAWPAVGGAAVVVGAALLRRMVL